ncbi:MAG TPA: hypothetical protein VFS20_22950 [Longimicrobium sp.]|nr:hypothetical protein [Longimicrobium sp.]
MHATRPSSPDARPAHRRRLRRAGIIAGVWLALLSAPAAGRRTDGRGLDTTTTAAAPVRRPARGRPQRPFWLTLLTLVSCGTAGAAAADRALGRRDRAERAARGGLRRLVVGSAAAVGAASAGEPRGWWPLAALAAAAGLGAEAMVIALRGCRLGGCSLALKVRPAIVRRLDSNQERR